jgi:Lipocalin-like domain
MKRILKLATMALCLGVAMPELAQAQTAKELVGTWTMVSNVVTLPDGKKFDIWGPHGTGIAIFDSNGHFAIINVNPDAPKFASNNRTTGTPEENKTAVQDNLALFGTYSVEGKVITYKIEASSYPNWTGTEQKRNVTSFTSDAMTYTLAASVGGTAENTWKKVK